MNQASEPAGADAMVHQPPYMKTASSTTTLFSGDHPRFFRVLPKPPHHRSDRSSPPSNDAPSATGLCRRLLSGVRRPVNADPQPLLAQSRRRSLSRTPAYSAGAHPPLPVCQSRLPPTDVRRASRGDCPAQGSPYRPPSRPAPRRRPGAGRQRGSAHGGHDGSPGRRHDPAAPHP